MAVMLIVLLNVQNLLGWLYFLISESVSAWYVYLIAKSLLSVCLLVLSPTYHLVSASDLVPALSCPALFTFDPLSCSPIVLQPTQLSQLDQETTPRHKQEVQVLGFWLLCFLSCVPLIDWGFPHLFSQFIFDLFIYFKRYLKNPATNL